eukprot:637680-Pleurochrysis_carterae.AAC.2
MTSVRGPESPGDESEFAPVYVSQARGGRAAVPLASAVGGGHEETATAGAGARSAVVEAEESADAAHASWLKCASDPTATLRGVVV